MKNLKPMLDIFFIVFCWATIVIFAYEAQLHIDEIKNQDLKIVTHTIYYSMGAIVVTLAFVAEYLKK